MAKTITCPCCQSNVDARDCHEPDGDRDDRFEGMCATCTYRDYPEDEHPCILCSHKPE